MVPPRCCSAIRLGKTLSAWRRIRLWTAPSDRLLCFMLEELRPAGEGDPDFTGRLLQLYEKQAKQGMTQPLQLGCLRYYVHCSRSLESGPNATEAVESRLLS